MIGNLEQRRCGVRFRTRRGCTLLTDTTAAGRATILATLCYIAKVMQTISGEVSCEAWRPIQFLAKKDPSRQGGG